MSAKVPLDEMISVRVSAEQLARLDGVVAAHQRARPGVSFSRADAVRALIETLDSPELCEAAR